MTADVVRNPMEGDPPTEGPRVIYPPEQDWCTRDNRCPACLVDVTFDARPRCTATSKQRHHRCQRAATPGATVCKSHGSAAPAVRRRAQLRLASLVDPAIATLAREMTKADRSRDRQYAANSILDRAGVVRGVDVTVDTARDILTERLIQIRDAQTTDDGAHVVTDLEADGD